MNRPCFRLRIFTGLLLILFLSGCRHSGRSTPDSKLRIIVSSDIGGDDPDDYQSMVHLLLYADRFDIEGLISSPPGKGRKSNILEVIDAYEKDYHDLVKFSRDYPEPGRLRKVCLQGAVLPQKEESPGLSISEGAEQIIRIAKKRDTRPLYILVWGAITDVAQAVHSDPSIANKIRIYSIGSWNTKHDQKARDYLYNQHPELWWIENNTTFRGMYMGGDQTGEWGNDSFVQVNVKGHGSLGEFFYSKKQDIKMGDTPSVLYLLNGNPGNPEGESWGGSFIKNGHGIHYWTDNPDPALQVEGKAGAFSVCKWRKNYLEDWAARLQFLLLCTE